MKKNQNEGMASTSNNEALMNKMVELCREYGYNYAQAVEEVPEEENGYLYDELMSRLYSEDAEGAENYLMRQFMDKYADVFGEDVCEDFLNTEWYDMMEDAFSNGIEDSLGKQTKIEVVKIKTTSLGSDAIKGVWDDDKYVPTLANCTVMLHYADGTDKNITINNFFVLDGNDGTGAMVKKVVRYLIPSLTYNAEEHKAFQQKVQEYVVNHLTVVEHKGYRYYDIVD